MKKERDLLPDILKGFAIIMVIFGHCIQEGNGADFSNNMLYFDDKLYQFIYSFHMPLFSLIAGYFAYYSIIKTPSEKKWQLLGKRVFTYFIPITVWTLLEFIREAALNTYYGFISYNILSFIKGYFSKLIINHWFLWSMIISFIIVWFSYYFVTNKTTFYIVLFISLFFIPDGFNFHAYKFLLPYYVLAFYINQNKKYLSFLFSKINLSLAFSTVAFILLFIFYRREAMIYVSGYRITKNIWWQMLIIDLYRFTIGLIGSMFFIFLFSKITSIFKNYKFPILTAFGRNSLGVYLVSGYSTILIMRRYTDSLLYNIPRVLLETLIISIFSLLISIFISKIPYIKRIVGK